MGGGPNYLRASEKYINQAEKVMRIRTYSLSRRVPLGPRSRPVDWLGCHPRPRGHPPALPQCRDTSQAAAFVASQGGALTIQPDHEGLRAL